MHYIIGYDENGRPMYEQIDPDDFGKAATNVTKGFTEFLTTLSKGFEDISYWAIFCLDFMDDDI